jgi:hypothetical protein
VREEDIMDEVEELADAMVVSEVVVRLVLMGSAVDLLVG